MTFRLVIAEGRERGRQFEYDARKGEVSIGRAAQNDIVIRDSGVSREHLRIVQREGRCFAEDLNSANGTRVNGLRILGPSELTVGDLLATGTVVFAFSRPDPSAGASTERVDAHALQAIVSAAGGGAGAFYDPDAETGESWEGVPEFHVNPVGSPPRPGPRAPEPVRLPRAEPAADRARRRRRFGSTLGGQLRFHWSELPLRAKQALMGAAALLILGIAVAVWPSDRRPSGPEPEVLTRQPLEGSFGVGKGVTWERPDDKTFYLDLVAPTRALAVLHYRAEGIAEGEVTVWVNGAQVGYVPADGAVVGGREVEQVLPVARLKRHARNEVVFDSTRNPPARDPWRIEGLWAEVMPLPAASEAELERVGRELYQRARDLERQHQVSPENLFQAWRAYRDAWLSFEGLAQPPELRAVAQVKVSDVRNRLEELCSRLLLEAERALRLQNRKKARAALEEVPRYFPTPEHRCHNLALEKIARYGL